MKKLLTLDVGTTAVKVGLFREDLSMEALVINEYQLETPRRDWVELDPAVYWENAVRGIRSVLEKTGAGPGEVAAVTCTTQGETLIPVGPDGQVLHPAIVWLDARAGREAQRIAEDYPPHGFYAVTGLPEVNAYCPVAKLLWLRDNLPELYASSDKLMLLEDWLIFRLCGRAATNPALLCSTGYFDIVQNRVWTDLLDRFGLDPGKIPEVLPCGTPVGTLLPGVAAELGLDTEVVVSTGAMDQVAAALGAGNLTDGVVAESTGTCLAVAATVERPDLQHWSPVTVYSHAVEGRYLLMTVTQTAGILLKWFRNEFCRDLVAAGGDVFARMDELAGQAPPLSNGLALYPHFTGIQFPQADEGARGVFFGVGMDTGRDCFIRAILEGVGYALRESIELMGLHPEQVLALGGGARSDIWCRIKADILGARIVSPEVEEAASLGAAMLGGVACGLFRDLLQAAERPRRGRRFEPDRGTGALYEGGYRRYQEMYGRFRPLFDRQAGRSS